MHGLEVTRLNSKKYQRLKKNFIKTIKYSDKVISVSNYTKNEAYKIINTKKINVIPNFVNLDEFYPLKKSKIIKERKPYNGKKVILSLSRIVRRKGHHIVLKSLQYLKKEIPNFIYLIAGNGDTDYINELKALSKSLNINKNVKFLGFIEENEKNKIYNICDVYIMNSHQTNENGDSEGFGISFIEANACAKPVIGTKVGGVTDAIKNEVNGLLIEPNDPIQTYSAMICILKNKKMYDKISRQSLKLVKKDFDLEVIGQRYKEIIDELYDSV